MASTAQRRLDAFSFGMGVEPEQHTCTECGYSSPSRKNFKRSEDGDGLSCSTGHYTNKAGETKRQKNLYARGR